MEPRSRLGRGTWIVLLALTPLVALPSLAPASVDRAGGISYSSKRVTIPGGSTGRLIKAACPRGTHVLNGGFISRDPRLRIGQAFPFDSSDSSSAPDDGWATRVSDTSVGDEDRVGVAHAICAKEAVLYDEQQAPMDAGASADFTLDCPDSSEAVGGGARTATKRMLVERSIAAHSPEGWNLTLDNQHFLGVTTTQYVICLEGVVDPISAMETSTGGGLTITAPCPSDSFLYGGGFENAQDFTPYSLGPSGSGPSGWRIRLSHLNPGNEVTVEALCGPSLAGG
jgi:hypothetical protein